MPAPLTRSRIHEVIKPAVHLRRFVGEETKGGGHCLTSHLMADPAVVGGNAIRGQAEAGSGDACNSFVVPLSLEFAVSQSTVKHQTRARIGLLPKIAESAA